MPPDGFDGVLESAAAIAAERLRTDATAGLDSLESLRALAEQFRRGVGLEQRDVAAAIRGLWTLLPEAEPRPTRREPDGSALTEAYRSRLEALP